MSFDTKLGTYGTRQFRGPVMAWLNRTMASWFGRRSRPFQGFQVLALTTIGRKSGIERTAPVAWFSAGEGSWLIVASVGGAAAHPDWFLNIAAHPDQVRIDVEGRSVAVVARQLHGEERAAAWQQIVTASPNFANYQKKTDREIPVIRLDEAAEGA